MAKGAAGSGWIRAVQTRMVGVLWGRPTFSSGGQLADDDDKLTLEMV